MNDFLEEHCVRCVENDLGCCLPQFQSKLQNTQVELSDDVQVEFESSNCETQLADRFSLGDSLQSFFPLLEMVFSYLPAADLHTVKEINLTWKELAEKEIAKRIYAASLCAYMNCSIYLYLNRSFYYSNIETCLIFYDWKRMKPKKPVCLHSSKPNQISFSEYIHEHLVPAHANYCALGCSKISSTIFENPVGDVLYQAVYLPHIPKIRMLMFRKFGKKTKNLMKPNENIRGLLILYKKFTDSYIRKGITTLIGSQNPNTIAIAGGIMKCIDSSVPLTNDSSKDIICIAFLEDETNKADFDAFSIVVRSGTMNDNDAFNVTVQRFRENVTARTHGVLFRFCCFSRYGKEAENHLLAKHFHNYKIMSVDVYGEVGWSSHNCAYFDYGEYLNDDLSFTDPAEPSKPKRCFNFPELLHGFTSILFFITWGPKI